MTHAEHKARHIELHKALDELIADWIKHSPPPNVMTRLPSQHTIAELMKWSHEQTIDPTE